MSRVYTYKTYEGPTGTKRTPDRTVAWIFIGAVFGRMLDKILNIDVMCIGVLF